MLFIVILDSTSSIYKNKLIVKQYQVDPSGGIPEERIILGGDSIMCFVSPEDIPVFQTFQRKKIWRWRKTVILMTLNLCRPNLMCASVLVSNEKAKKNPF